jgi:type II secretory pathway pseudopilin PulG
MSIIHWIPIVISVIIILVPIAVPSVMTVSFAVSVQTAIQVLQVISRHTANAIQRNSKSFASDSNSQINSKKVIGSISNVVSLPTIRIRWCVPIVPHDLEREGFWTAVQNTDRISTVVDDQFTFSYLISICRKASPCF